MIMMFVLSILVTLSSAQTSGDENDRKFCNYLPCGLTNVLGERLCAAGGNVLGYCMCLLANGNSFAKYFACEKGYVYHVQKGYCVKGKAKKMSKCDEKGKLLKKKTSWFGR
uniref:Putative 7.8 kDa secreted protein n=2 Tax=Culex tarsalis TaxID=7177 RepID=A0A1Q3EUS3_CULTA